MNCRKTETKIKTNNVALKIQHTPCRWAVVVVVVDAADFRRLLLPVLVPVRGGGGYIIRDCALILMSFVWIVRLDQLLVGWMSGVVPVQVYRRLTR